MEAALNKYVIQQLLKKKLCPQVKVQTDKAAGATVLFTKHKLSKSSARLSILALMLASKDAMAVEGHTLRQTPYPYSGDNLL